jgi:Ca-activated chloride channel family protein
MLRAFWFGGLALPLAAIVFWGCSANSAPSAAPAPAASKNAEVADLGEGRYARGVVVDGFAAAQPAVSAPASPQDGTGPGLGGDKYAYIEETGFGAAKDSPLSTFSIDVDTASYSKTRSYLLEHHTLPPPDAVRIEELINYFDYAYAGPTDEHPFAVHLETAECPWRPEHRLVRFGIQGKRIDEQRPVSNLVFLIDVSGSMGPANRLPLVQRGLSLLVRQLGENDHVAIVVYAGAAGLVLPPTSGSERQTILNAIENLRTGGSTNGGQGIHLAYQIAKQNYVKGGVNRVLLCTDGDFNVGTTSTGELVRLAAEKAKDGIHLSVLGFGFGNHNDALLEQLANKADGNYAFIDSDQEAYKVLVQQMQGTLVTIAKDVKLQVEFNPAQVAAYRLIGYENRRLADRDFNDDTKDAGDIGAGHSVTALYEIVPVGVESEVGRPEVDPLKYQGPGARGQESEKQTEAAKSGELLTLKLRYQPPAGGASTLLTYPLQASDRRFSAASADLQFAAAVASFGMLLRNSQHKGNASYAAVLETASAARGKDERGLRSEFLELVQAAQRLVGEKVGAIPAIWQPANHARLATRRAQPSTAALSGLSARRVFILGLATGILVVVVTAAACLLLARIERRPISFAPVASLKAK